MALLLLISVLALPLYGQKYQLSEFAGREHLKEGAKALEIYLRNPSGIAIDNARIMYVADSANHHILRIAPDGSVSIYAGTGEAGWNGENVERTEAQFNGPTSLGVDAAGNLYVLDTLNHRIRRIGLDGRVRTVGGNGTEGSSGDRGPATEAAIAAVSFAVHSDGSVYLAESSTNRLRFIDRSGFISTIAGNGEAGYAEDGEVASESSINAPSGVAIGGLGNLFFSETGNNLIRIVGPSGRLETLAASEEAGFAGDGGPATGARMLFPRAIFVDAQGNVIFFDSGNRRIRLITPQGVINTIAGDGRSVFLPRSEDPLLTPVLDVPAFAVDPNRGLYYVEAGANRIQHLSAGRLTRVVGSDVGDGGIASSAFLSLPFGLVISPSGDVLVADAMNNRIRSIKVTGNAIQTTFGNGTPAGVEPDAPQSGLPLPGPVAVAFDSSGNMYIVDSGDRVRRVSTTGEITFIAGVGTPGFSGDGGPAATAAISGATSIAVDDRGVVYIADNGNKRVRAIDTNGRIFTVAGNGSGEYAGDGGPATLAQLDPFDIALDRSGNLYIADFANNRIRRVTRSGIISTVAGNGRAASDGDDGPATAASLNTPTGIAFDREGVLYVAETLSGSIRRITPDGTISALSIDDPSAAADGSSNLRHNVMRIAINSAGDIFLSDPPRDRVLRLRRLDPAGTPAIDEASIQPVAPNAIVTITGRNLAAGGVDAMAGDGPRLPTVLGGTCVRVDAIAASLVSVRPDRIRFVVPQTAFFGNLTVRVITGCGTNQEVASLPATMPVQAAAPTFLYTSAGQIWVLRSGTDQPVGSEAAPARRGERITLFVTGLGPTVPPIEPGEIVTADALLEATLSVTFGERLLDPSSVPFTGLAVGRAGVYRVDIVVPADVADGRHAVSLAIADARTPQDAFIYVRAGN